MATTTALNDETSSSMPPSPGRGSISGAKTDTIPRSHWDHAWSRFRRDGLAMIGGLGVVILFIMAIGAPWLAPYDPLTQFPDGLSGDYAEPVPLFTNLKFPLGTDSLGRDILTRLIWGGRISMTVALFANVISISMAIFLGGIAGFFGGVSDTIIMRTVDLFLAFPVLLLQIVLATVLPPSLFTVILVITIFGWVYPSRIFRGQVLSIRENLYVVAARSVGTGQSRILSRHILPQLWPTIIILVTLRVPAAILTEAGLSFIGLGVRPPTPSWGNMILEGFRFYRTAPWIVLLPGLAIMVAVLSFNLLGDGLRDALDPKQGH